jgi:hypothetical protein
MKKLLVVFAMIGSMSLFSAENKVEHNVDPLIIYTSCGTSHVMDDAGLSWDDIFDTAEDYEWFDCGPGKDLIFVGW